MPDFEFVCESYGRFKEGPPGQGFVEVDLRWRRVMVVCSGWSHNSTENESKPATRLDLGHQFNTMDSETELCKRLNVVVGQETLNYNFF